MCQVRKIIILNENTAIQLLRISKLHCTTGKMKLQLY